jgi:hypothetical protein
MVHPWTALRRWWKQRDYHRTLLPLPHALCVAVSTVSCAVLVVMLLGCVDPTTNTLPVSTASLLVFASSLITVVAAACAIVVVVVARRRDTTIATKQRIVSAVGAAAAAAAAGGRYTATAPSTPGLSERDAIYQQFAASTLDTTPDAVAAAVKRRESERAPESADEYRARMRTQTLKVAAVMALYIGGVVAVRVLAAVLLAGHFASGDLSALVLVLPVSTAWTLFLRYTLIDRLRRRQRLALAASTRDPQTIEIAPLREAVTDVEMRRRYAALALLAIGPVVVYYQATRDVPAMSLGSMWSLVVGAPTLLVGGACFAVADALVEAIGVDAAPSAASSALAPHHHRRIDMRWFPLQTGVALLAWSAAMFAVVDVPLGHRFLGGYSPSSSSMASLPRLPVVAALFDSVDSDFADAHLVSVPYAALWYTLLVAVLATAIISHIVAIVVARSVLPLLFASSVAMAAAFGAMMLHPATPPPNAPSVVYYACGVVAIALAIYLYRWNNERRIGMLYKTIYQHKMDGKPTPAPPLSSTTSTTNSRYSVPEQYSQRTTTTAAVHEYRPPAVLRLLNTNGTIPFRDLLLSDTAKPSPPQPPPKPLIERMRSAASDMVGALDSAAVGVIAAFDPSAGRAAATPTTSSTIRADAYDSTPDTSDADEPARRAIDAALASSASSASEDSDDDSDADDSPWSTVFAAVGMRKQ